MKVAQAFEDIEASNLITMTMTNTTETQTKQLLHTNASSKLITETSRDDDSNGVHNKNNEQQDVNTIRTETMITMKSAATKTTTSKILIPYSR